VSFFQDFWDEEQLFCILTGRAVSERPPDDDQLKAIWSGTQAGSVAFVESREGSSRVARFGRGIRVRDYQILNFDFMLEQLASERHLRS
jgi:hypothetical protein